MNISEYFALIDSTLWSLCTIPNFFIVWVSGGYYLSFGISYVEWQRGECTRHCTSSYIGKCRFMKYVLITKRNIGEVFLLWFLASRPILLASLKCSLYLILMHTLRSGKAGPNACQPTNQTHTHTLEPHFHMVMLRMNTRARGKKR